jgi:hypothetical protein
VDVLADTCTGVGLLAELCLDIALAAVAQISSSTVSPLRFRPMVLRSSWALLIALPSTLRMMSPALTPAFSAAESAMTCDTSAPWVSLTP